MEGEDLDVTNISYTYDDDMINFINDCVSTYKEKEFDLNIFLDKIHDIKTIIKIIDKMYPEKGLEHLQKYIENKYHAIK